MFTFPELEFPSWWGTEVVKNTADVLGTPLRILEPGYIIEIINLTIDKKSDPLFGRELRVLQYVTVLCKDRTHVIKNSILAWRGVISLWASPVVGE